MIPESEVPRSGWYERRSSSGAVPAAGCLGDREISALRVPARRNRLCKALPGRGWQPACSSALGFNYGFDSWIKMAFDELMLVPVNNISTEDNAMIGWPAFRALAKAQLQVMDAWLNLAVCVPVVNHCNECYVHSFCQGEWAKMWTSMDGVLGALIKEELPGSQILEKLPTFYCSGMNSECHRRTCDGLKGSVDKLSILREEEELIDKAVEELMSSTGIPSSK
ncbi:hypothetical protein C8R45DRAFT_948170 [Mycena sanguinolenta]|nr:hypothetical protein C8R45DRAFT_948170 [Mycena sanguinolenta]